MTGVPRRKKLMEAHVLALGAEAKAGRITTRARYAEPGFDDALKAMAPMLAADLGILRHARFRGALVRWAAEFACPASIEGEDAVAVFRLFVLPIHGRASAVVEAVTSAAMQSDLADAIWDTGLARRHSNGFLLGHAVELGALAAATPGRVNALTRMLADLVPETGGEPAATAIQARGWLSACLGPDVTDMDLPAGDPVGNFGLVGIYLTSHPRKGAVPVDRFGGREPFRHGDRPSGTSGSDAWVRRIGGHDLFRRCLVGMPESIPDAVDFLGSCHLRTAVRTMSAHLGIGPDDRIDELHVCREGGAIAVHLGEAGAVAGPVVVPPSVARTRMPYLEGAMEALARRADTVREHAAMATMPEAGVGAHGHARPN